MTEQTKDGVTYAIRHRLTGEVLFEGELPAKISAEPPNIKLGAAIELAVKSGTDLVGADLVGADLSGADLSRADLSGADLSRADLSRSYLVGAYLSGANLRRADLSGAYLSGAYLSGAYLSGADLSRSYLSGADLSGVEDVIAGGQPNGFWAYGWREKNTGVLRVKIGCQDKTIAKAREYWSPSHPYWSDRQEIPAALDMIEAIARLRGWLS